MTLEEGLRAQVAALRASTKEDERRIEHYRSVLCTIQEQECQHCESPEIAGGALHYFSDGCAHGWRNATNETESLRAQVAALRDALGVVVDWIPGIDHHESDCPGDCEGHALKWIVNRALADTARAATEHDERVRREACGCNCHGHEWGGELHPTHRDCREAIEEEREALVRAEIGERVRREALEEAAKIAKVATGPAYTTDPIALDYLQTKIVEGIRALAAEPKNGGYGWSQHCDAPEGPCGCGATHKPRRAP